MDVHKNQKTRTLGLGSGCGGLAGMGCVDAGQVIGQRKVQKLVGGDAHRHGHRHSPWGNAGWLFIRNNCANYSRFEFTRETWPFSTSDKSTRMDGEVGLWEWEGRTDPMGADSMEWRGGRLRFVLFITFRNSQACLVKFCGVGFNKFIV